MQFFEHLKGCFGMIFSGDDHRLGHITDFQAEVSKHEQPGLGRPSIPQSERRWKLKSAPNVVVLISLSHHYYN